MRNPRIGLALGSGAARGWAHIGVIEALIEAGIEPDVVCGSSMGALVGAAYIAGRLDALKASAETMSWREIVRLLDIRVTGGGLIDGKKIVAYLHRLGIDAPIESYPKKFAAVAADLANGREVWLQDGQIAEAVRASITIPGILSPVSHDGHWLLDGGLVNPVPVSACRALGAEVIIAVNLNGELLGRRFVEETPDQGEVETHAKNEFLGRILSQMPNALRNQASLITRKLLQPGPETPGYFDVLATAINIMQDRITRARLAGDPPHVLLMPRLAGMGLLQFDRARDAIAEGRAAVESALPVLQRYRAEG
ncbi:MAG TPA: patatin-like phospholipase family protein [Ferrovibrio sp.]|uniref:patatin-like phospholipase family protein n=1 Tax=Ferrovibrio sp. TaxID=1917215 RepID=UPI002ED67D1F